ncbi:xanthine dehydrogenase family protein molybdopterin-binding subunit [Bradyrhizobium sp. NP1]|uniref:xanthine dehydrogenase family protein molybdopterin-binding subunit n=1 Tax=Bradyrhizobium sp. NP1 TaxID=3049772 RepID=UPI0025A623A0|nr:xanthine dehydrogenase family protein molybdopterin-binding subunit [Bradyrhizobium sp. NP1]WJR79895.1 xanthine dehydrogenase family protein molybdopterin-binding subunit [Bradyrhizobium sp. NP1]
MHTSNPRADLVEKVTGRATFVTDIELPGMLHAFAVRSPMVHARIVSIDAAAAREQAGVVDVLTGADVASLGNWGLLLKDRPVLAIDRVRYVGEPVALVIAESHEIAEDAAELVQVDYDGLPPVCDAGAALAADAPLVHERHDIIADYYFKGQAKPVENSNIFHRFVSEVGDVAAAEASAALVHEDRFSFPSIFHYALEPHTVIADYGADQLTVWAGAQTPAAVQKTLSRLFGLPLARVRVIVPFVGGGFGGKASVKIEPLVAAASWKLRRPVRLAQSLSESMLTCRRLSADICIRTAVNTEGRILAKSARIVLDGGAYADTGPAIATKAANRIIGPYVIPNLKLESMAVYTNKVPGAAFRSIGGPQAVWAAESHMDNIAARIGLSPTEFRLRNLASRGERIRPDLRPLDIDMGELMGAVGQAVVTNVVDGERVGRGLAVGASDPGIVPMSNALVRLKIDGSILIAVASVEIGQGVQATMANIAAKALNQPVEAVTVLATDTAIAPFDWGTGASRSTVIVGLSVEAAARDAAEQIIAMAADVLGVEGGKLVLVPGGLSDGATTIPFETVFHKTFGVDSGEVIGRGAITPRSKNGAFAQAPLFWETAAGIAEVVVDEDTGEITLRQYGTAADVGRVINRVAAEGQDEGATIQGLGHALFEELVFEDGQPVNATPIDYAIPTIEDIPRTLHTILIEHGDGPGPQGARGMGEGAILPIAPAIANAIFAAHGVRVTDLPLTPEKVWRALKQRS